MWKISFQLPSLLPLATLSSVEREKWEGGTIGFFTLIYSIVEIAYLKGMTKGSCINFVFGDTIFSFSLFEVQYVILVNFFPCILLVGLQAISFKINWFNHSRNLNWMITYLLNVFRNNFRYRQAFGLCHQ